jgi:hypothetical protein
MKGAGCVAWHTNFCKKKLGEREHLGELGSDTNHRTDIELGGW